MAEVDTGPQLNQYIQPRVEVRAKEYSSIKMGVPTLIELGGDSLVALPEPLKQGQDHPSVFFFNGSGTTDWTQLQSGRMIDIGSNPDKNQVIRPHGTVSRQHAQLTYGKGESGNESESQDNSNETYYVAKNPESLNQVYTQEIDELTTQEKTIPKKAWRYARVTDTNSPVFTIGETKFHFKKESGKILLYSTYAKDGASHVKPYIFNERECISIGRDLDCDYNLDYDELASKDHATVVVDGDVIVLRDNGSTNGTKAQIASTEKPPFGEQKKEAQKKSENIIRQEKLINVLISQYKYRTGKLAPNGIRMFLNSEQEARLGTTDGKPDATRLAELIRDGTIGKANYEDILNAIADIPVSRLDDPRDIPRNRRLDELMEIIRDPSLERGLDAKTAMHMQLILSTFGSKIDTGEKYKGASREDLAAMLRTAPNPLAFDDFEGREKFLTLIKDEMGQIARDDFENAFAQLKMIIYPERVRQYAEELGNIHRMLSGSDIPKRKPQHEANNKQQAHEEPHQQHKEQQANHPPPHEPEKQKPPEPPEPKIVMLADEVIKYIKQGSPQIKKMALLFGFFNQFREDEFQNAAEFVTIRGLTALNENFQKLSEAALNLDINNHQGMVAAKRLVSYYRQQIRVSGKNFNQLIDQMDEDKKVAYKKRFEEILS